jgi:hypothetical protein
MPTEHKKIITSINIVDVLGSFRLSLLLEDELFAPFFPAECLPSLSECLFLAGILFAMIITIDLNILMKHLIQKLYKADPH